jgi:uncharacterized protein (TIGR00255 family)
MAAMVVRSMTGLGRGRGGDGGHAFVAEVRTVNHKYLEVKVKLPNGLHALEPRVSALVRQRLTRGRVDVGIFLGEGSAPVAALRLDETLARAAVAAFNGLGKQLGLPGEVSVSDLVRLHETLFTAETLSDVDALWPAVETAVKAALKDAETMRTQEGAALAQDLDTRLKVVAHLCAQLQERAPLAVAETQARLRARVAELVGNVNLDPSRLVQECALLAERSDTAEELTRLRGHLEHFRALLGGKEPAGRKLDFLCQELHREANTMASKAADSVMQACVVDLKAEIERLREQVQNIE